MSSVHECSTIRNALDFFRSTFIDTRGALNQEEKCSFSNLLLAQNKNELSGSDGDRKIAFLGKRMNESINE